MPSTPFVVSCRPETGNPGLDERDAHNVVLFRRLTGPNEGSIRIE